MSADYNILLICSQPEDVKEEMKFLEKVGFSVIRTSSAGEALKRLEVKKPPVHGILLGPVGDDAVIYSTIARGISPQTSVPLLFLCSDCREEILDSLDAIPHRGIIPLSGGPALLKRALKYAIAENNEKDPLAQLIEITEEAEQEYSRSDYAYLLSTLTDAVIIDKLDEGIAIANKKCCDLLGLTGEEIKNGKIYKSGWSFIREDLTVYPPEEHPHVIARNRGKPLRNLTMGINRPGKETLWISVTALPVFKTDNETLNGVITTFFDISELVNIRNRNLRLAAVFENADWGIIIGSVKAETMDQMNPAYARMHGYTLEEIESLKPGELTAPEDRERVARLMELASDKKHTRFETIRRRKDGTTFPAILDMTTINDHEGQPIYRAVNLLDITNAKKQELSLKESLAEKETLLDELKKEKEYSDTLFYKSPIAIYSLDRENRIVNFNQKAEEITGFGRDELLGRKFDLYKEEVKSDDEVGREYLIHTKSGDEKIIERYGSVLKSKEGKPLGTIESFIDITNWKELQSFRSDMERVIRHDLKTPLNSIIGFPKLMLTDETLSDEYREYLMIILLAGQNMLNLINASLNLYKLEGGTYHFNMEKTDVIPQLYQIRNILRDDCRKKENAIEITYRGNPPTGDENLEIVTEKSLFIMILINLIKNAIEASPKGEAVRVNVADSGRHLEISIHNKGAVPVEIRDRFFEKNVTMGKKDGNGLGTYSAKLMANAINADVSFITDDREGTTLFLKL